MASQDHRLGSSEPTQRSQGQIAPESFHVQVLKLRGLWDFLSMSGLLGASSLRKGVPGRFPAYGSLQEPPSCPMGLLLCSALLFSPHQASLPPLLHLFQSLLLFPKFLPFLPVTPSVFTLTGRFPPYVLNIQN